MLLLKDGCFYLRSILLPEMFHQPKAASLTPSGQEKECMLHGYVLQTVSAKEAHVSIKCFIHFADCMSPPVQESVCQENSKLVAEAPPYPSDPDLTPQYPSEEDPGALLPPRSTFSYYRKIYSKKSYMFC